MGKATAGPGEFKSDGKWMTPAQTMKTHLEFDPKDKKHKRLIDVPDRDDKGEIKYEDNPAAVASIEREFGEGVRKKPCLAFPEPEPAQPIIVQQDNSALVEALKVISEMKKELESKSPKEKGK